VVAPVMGVGVRISSAARSQKTIPNHSGLSFFIFPKL
jgi:hypothetical protein